MSEQGPAGSKVSLCLEHGPAGSEVFLGYPKTYLFLKVLRYLYGPNNMSANAQRLNVETLWLGILILAVTNVPKCRRKKERKRERERNTIAQRDYDSVSAPPAPT